MAPKDAQPSTQILRKSFQGGVSEMRRDQRRTLIMDVRRQKKFKQNLLGEKRKEWGKIVTKTKKFNFFLLL